MHRNQNFNQNLNIAPANQGPRFDGINANRISETYAFGREGEAYLDKKFDYLKRQGTAKYAIKKTKAHPHPYAAFCRKHCHAAIMLGCCANARVIDVGGHAMRNRVSLDANGNPWTDNVHTLLPIVDMNDQLRHDEWREKYRNNAWAWPMPNSCAGKATLDGLCQCVDVQGVRIVDQADVFTSIDSAYYPEVMEGIEWEQMNRNRPAYYTFHDYHSALRKGVMTGTTFDKESTFHIEKRGRQFWVKVQTHGNPFFYEHPVINTQSENVLTPDTWVRYDPTNDKSFVYNVINRMDTGAGYDYVTVRSQALLGKHPLAKVDMEYFVYLEEDKRNLKEPIDELTYKKVGDDMFTWIERTLKGVNHVSKNVMKVVTDTWELSQRVKARFNVELEIADAESEVFVIRIRDEKTNDEVHMRKFRYNLQYLKIAIKELAGKVEMSDIVRAQRVLMRHHADTSEDVVRDMDLVQGSVGYATWLNTETMISMFEYYDGNLKVSKVKQYLKGISQLGAGGIWSTIKRYSKNTMLVLENFAQNYFLRLLFQVIFVYSVVCGVNYLMTATTKIIPGVNALEFGSPDTNSEDFYQVLVTVFLVLANMSAAHCRKFKWLTGTCVTDKNRLDLKKNQGSYPAQWKFKNPEMDISRCKSGIEAAEKLGCNKCGKIEAGQIGPIIWGGEYRTPTVKHCCKQNIMAASIRATTNKLQPDLMHLELWEKNALMPIFEEIANGLLKKGGIDVDYDIWLKKYPQDYREKIYKRLRAPDLFEKKYTYDSFPKKEMQYTTVSHDLKDTDLNTVKERQISGPSEDKKIVANALINLLEEIAGDNVKGYCGRKNWLSICGGINRAISSIKNIIWCCADGSGFDMTQTKHIQEAFNRCFKWLLEQDLIDLGPLVTNDHVMEVFRQSLILNVNVCRGDVTYRAEGRASGDGWTTFGNTILMVSYWRYTLMMAGVPKTEYHLLVKGDDVLFGLNKNYKVDVDAMTQILFATKNEDMAFGLGQIVKFLKWGDIDECDFLSCMFFYGRDGVRMVRIPDRVFQTMPWSLKISPGMKNLDELRQELTYSKGSSLLAWSRGLPIFECLAHKLMSLGHPGANTEYNAYADEGREWFDDDDRLQFTAWLAFRFGITDAEIAEIESKIQGITTLNTDIEIPCLGKFQE